MGTLRAMFRALIGLALVLAGTGCPGDPVQAPVADIAAPDALDEAMTDAGADVSADGAPDIVGPDAPSFTGVPWPETSCVAFDPTSDDPTAAMFDPDCVVDVDITMSPNDWQALRNEERTLIDVLAGDCMAAPPADVFSWYVAEVKVGGQVVSGAGIRKKGFIGSLSDTKPSLKVKFDEFIDGQRLSGMKRLTLNNMQQDTGYTTACLAYDFMRKLGIAAPRCNFARVRVNNVDLGLYAHVESIKSAFLERHFATSDGNLYEGTVSDFRPEFRNTFEKKNNKTENDWSDVDAVIAAMEAEDDQLVAALEPLIDVDQFFTFWAAEVLVAHWDGYAGNTNNFYIYRDFVGGDGKFRFIPWGIDAAFETVPELAGEGEYVPKSVLAYGALATRLYAIPETRAIYHARLESLMTEHWDTVAMSAEVERMRALLLPHLNETDQLEVNQKLNFRKSWITHRRQELLTELQPVPPEWEYGMRETICWPKAGTVNGTFITTWGSSGFDPTTSRGEVLAEVTGIGTLGNVSATARIGTAEGEEGEAVVEIIAQGDGDIFFLLRFIGPISSLQPNTSYPIDFQEYRGYLGYFIPLENQFSAFGFLYDGVISFDEAAPQPGQLVSGSFGADVILAPL